MINCHVQHILVWLFDSCRKSLDQGRIDKILGDGAMTRPSHEPDSPGRWYHVLLIHSFVNKQEEAGRKWYLGRCFLFLLAGGGPWLVIRVPLLLSLCCFPVGETSASVNTVMIQQWHHSKISWPPLPLRLFFINFFILNIWPQEQEFLPHEI